MSKSSSGRFHASDVLDRYDALFSAMCRHQLGSHHRWRRLWGIGAHLLVDFNRAAQSVFHAGLFPNHNPPNCGVLKPIASMTLSASKTTCLPSAGVTVTLTSLPVSSILSRPWCWVANLMPSRSYLLAVRETSTGRYFQRNHGQKGIRHALLRYSY